MENNSDINSLCNSNKSFSNICLGCKVNRAEIDEYSSIFIANGWAMTDIANADVIIVNTCTVTSTADRKTRKSIRSALGGCKASAKFIVTGCACAISPDTYRQLDSRIVVVPKAEMPEFCMSFSTYTKSIADSKPNIQYSNLTAKILASDNFRTRASIKIQDGCDNNCTFCIVHTARGKSTSMPFAHVMDKFKALVDAGVKEIVLTGVNLGAYNCNGRNLTSLCSAMLSYIKNADARIRLSSIEPQNVDEELIDLIATAQGKICRHFHLPLQSGSSKVLSEMNRHYNADEFCNLVDNIKQKIPTMALSTDVIVGFPGETDQDFADTTKVCKHCSFMKIHVFPYSIRENTPAAQRSDQIDANVKDKRAAELRKLSEELAMIDYSSRKDSAELALIESNKFARTESYHQIDRIVNNVVGEIGDLVQFRF